MRSCHIIFADVSYTYPGSVNPAVEKLSLNLKSGWSAFAGANGCGKTTALKLACSLLKPESGSVVSTGSAVYCPQRTEHPPEFLEDFTLDWSREVIALRKTLRLEDDWPGRWNTLSQGERKRLQIAVALWRKPVVLALDEPLNHLDTKGRDFILRAMEEFTGCGLLVTHDRQAMDDICSSTVLFRPDSISFYRSGYSLAFQEEKRQRELLVKRRLEAKENYLRKKRDARHKMLKARTIQAHSTGNRVSFKDICKYNLDGASRVDGIVQKAGQRSREAAGKAERARRHMESITYRKVHRSGIDLEGERSGRNYLLDLPEGSFRTGSRTVKLPELVITPKSRIALTGLNGSGKSTLLRHLFPRMNCPSDKLIWIPQEISSEESSRCLETALKLSGEELGAVMTLVRRLGSDPERLLDSAVPSPGESRKLLLALGLSSNPWLVVMDEPTNHMDLPSIQCLESALRDFTGGLLLVSHDRAFLNAVTVMEWRISGNRLEILYSELTGVQKGQHEPCDQRSSSR